MSNLLDLFTVAFLVLFAVIGACRGLVRTACGMVGSLLALLLATVFSPLITQAITPSVSALVMDRIAEKLTAAAGTATVEINGILGAALKATGLYDSVSKAISDAGALAVPQVAPSAAYFIVDFFLGGLVFLLCFFVLLLLSKVISGGLDLVARLPVLHLLNRVGGCVFGLLEGAVLLIAVGSVLTATGFISEDALSGSAILRPIVEVFPFSL